MSKLVNDLLIGLIVKLASLTKSFYNYQMKLLKRDKIIESQVKGAKRAASRAEKAIDNKRPRKEVEERTRELIHASRNLINDY